MHASPRSSTTATTRESVRRSSACLYTWAGSRGLIGPATRSFGIYYDDPESVPRAELRAHAGLTAAGAVDADALVVEIPPLLCASCTRARTRSSSGPIYSCSATGSPRAEPADHPCFEEYLNDARTLPPSEWLTRIYLPLAG